jgi:hypothetical protein
MNPPYNSGDGGAARKNEKIKRDVLLGDRIMKSLEKHRVVCISNYGSLSSNLTKITQIEKQRFPGIACTTYVWTMNDKKPVLFPIIHSLKTIKKSDYFFFRMGGNSLLYQIRKENKSINNRRYIEVKNDEEMNEINKYIKDNWEPYKVFVPCITWHHWIIANILYNSPWRERFVK